MKKSVIPVFVMGTAILSGCGGSSVENVQRQVAESFFANPQDVKFSDTFENSRMVCGFASGSVRHDRFVGPRPFWADADGGAVQIMTATAIEGFIINAARDCPTLFVNLLHDFPSEELSASQNDTRQPVDQ